MYGYTSMWVCCHVMSRAPCSFLIGHPGANAGSSIGVSGASDTKKSPWIYITVDGQLQSFRLYVYSVSA